MVTKNSTGHSAMNFLVSYMKKHPDCVYAEAAEAAKKAKFTIYPINWGRAQLLLGRVKPGSAKKRKEEQARRKSGGRRRANSGDSVTLPIEGTEDLERWQSVLEGINGGSSVSLRFDGSTWELVLD